MTFTSRCHFSFNSSQFFSHFVVAVAAAAAVITTAYRVTIVIIVIVICCSRDRCRCCCLYCIRIVCSSYFISFYSYFCRLFEKGKLCFAMCKALYETKKIFSILFSLFSQTIRLTVTDIYCWHTFEPETFKKKLFYTRPKSRSMHALLPALFSTSFFLFSLFLSSLFLPMCEK